MEEEEEVELGITTLLKAGWRGEEEIRSPAESSSSTRWRSGRWPRGLDSARLELHRGGHGRGDSVLPIFDFVFPIFDFVFPFVIPLFYLCFQSLNSLSLSLRPPATAPSGDPSLRSPVGSWEARECAGLTPRPRLPFLWSSAVFGAREVVRHDAVMYSTDRCGEKRYPHAASG